jgi:hypothetical protein
MGFRGSLVRIQSPRPIHLERIGQLPRGCWPFCFLVQYESVGWPGGAIIPPIGASVFIRSLGAILVLILVTACASTGQMAVPNWQRYQSGDLAGFLQAPGERVVRTLPEPVVVRRAQGRVVRSSSATPAMPPYVGPLESSPGLPRDTTTAPRTPDYGVVHTDMYVIELRGPVPSPEVRSIAVRFYAFDFGPLPNGTYVLKATVSGSTFDPGWRSEVMKIIVSDTADRNARIELW